ncbi:hypothetical protein RCIX1 [Methanocella arvoryzae MRE50]|uniref:Uncharacterized protein n=1 Tax=Methanocella arvoryzae (strain DSM 22066 / NBRC 105507 / MRE50) TaxID=351160 RepID=Q0W7X0_METAR|nr:hypothetical protein RCIX1 [Methanocella arvoryzae MRE50]
MKASTMKCRLIAFVLILAIIFTCGCFEAQKSIHVEDKYTMKTYGGADEYFIKDGANTFQCANSSIYDALGEGGTYTVTINANNVITKVIY